MIQKVILSIAIVVVILSLVLVALQWEEIQLKCALDRYNRMLDGVLPEDMELTIYYLPHDIVTRAPLTTE